MSDKGKGKAKGISFSNKEPRRFTPMPDKDDSGGEGSSKGWTKEDRDLAKGAPTPGKGSTNPALKNAYDRSSASAKEARKKAEEEANFDKKRFAEYNRQKAQSQTRGDVADELEYEYKESAKEKFRYE